MVSPATAAELAPTGRLRVAIMYTNPVLAAGTPASGGLRGIAVDLAHALAKYARLPLQIQPFETRKSLLSGVWDVAFAASDVKRDGISCTPPFLDTLASYLVPADSGIQRIDQVDADGVTIAVSAHSALEVHLQREIRHARVVSAPGAHGAADLWLSGQAHVLAGLKQQLLRVAPRMPDSRVLDGHFMAIRHALSTWSDRVSGHSLLCEFVEHAKVSGLVAQLIARHQIPGVAVSPPA